MAVSKKHRGLGRGLDALIPAAEPETEEITENNAGEDGQQKSSAKNGKSRTEESGKEKERSSEEYVRMVRITLVEPDRNQARKKFDEDKLEALAESIRNKGILEPIIVQEENDHYVIIAGERRWRASRIAGLKEIPVIVRNYNELEKAEVSLIENIQREDLNPIEEAKAYQRLMEEFHLTQEEIAGKVSKDRSSVANALRLLKLAEPVQKMVADGQLSMGHARALISVENKEQQQELAEKVAAGNMSVREVERMIRSLTSEKKTGKTAIKDPSLEAEYRDIESRMNSSLGMKVSIRAKTKDRGKVEIEFSSGKELETLMDRLLQ